MHLLIPYAASHAEGCQATLASLQLPKLQKLLSYLTAQPLDTGDELSFSPPHERALARSLGLPVVDGQIPWAAWQAHKHTHLANAGGAWAFVSLCHWQADKKQVTMHQIPMHDLSQAESDTLRAAMQPFFTEDGITLYPDTPGRWLAHGAVFAKLATASPDRVSGRNLEPWMPMAAQAGGLIRLVSEMQMLLYTHPLNDAREARGALPVNAIWLSGSGALPGTPTDAGNAQAGTAPGQLPVKANPGSWSNAGPIHHPVHPMHPTVIPALRDSALADNWPAWAAAWQTIDATQGQALLDAQARGEPVQLTLCGERHAQTWLTQPQPLMQKIKSFFGMKPIQNVLKQL